MYKFLLETQMEYKYCLYESMYEYTPRREASTKPPPPKKKEIRILNVRSRLFTRVTRVTLGTEIISHTHTILANDVYIV